VDDGRKHPRGGLTEPRRLQKSAPTMANRHDRVRAT
jgi:hypothetical protein